MENAVATPKLALSESISLSVKGPGMEKEKFLGDFLVEEGTGKVVAEALLKALIDWGILDRIIALAFDTCAINTGWKGGR